MKEETKRHEITMIPFWPLQRQHPTSWHSPSPPRSLSLKHSAAVHLCRGTPLPGQPPILITQPYATSSFLSQPQPCLSLSDSVLRHAGASQLASALRIDLSRGTFVLLPAVVTSLDHRPGPPRDGVTTAATTTDMPPVLTPVSRAEQARHD